MVLSHSAAESQPAQRTRTGRSTDQLPGAAQRSMHPRAFDRKSYFLFSCTSLNAARLRYPCNTVVPQWESAGCRVATPDTAPAQVAVPAPSPDGRTCPGCGCHTHRTSTFLSARYGRSKRSRAIGWLNSPPFGALLVLAPHGEHQPPTFDVRSPSRSPAAGAEGRDTRRLNNDNCTLARESDCDAGLEFW